MTGGLKVTELAKEDKWWNGPSFLKQDETEWPETKIEAKREPDKEIRKQYLAQKQVADQTFVTSTSENRLDPTRYSSWTKLTRVSSRVNRFVDNCRLPPNLRTKGPIEPEEISTAGRRFIILAQQEAFKEEIRALRAETELPSGSKLLPLRPKADEDGVLRCDGRLCYAESLPREARYPIILPRSHWVTKLIIKDTHEQNLHGGTNQVLAQLSARYWIISAREAIRGWERECMHCRRRKAHTSEAGNGSIAGTSDTEVIACLQPDLCRLWWTFHHQARKRKDPSEKVPVLVYLSGYQGGAS